MKKTIILFALAIAFMSCNKNTTTTKEFKTAYIDTSKLMKESAENKDIQTKYKEKAQKMGGELESEIARFKAEAATFKQDAAKNGQVWAQQKGAELQEAQQRISYADQALGRQIQEESGVELDSLIIRYKKIIKGYGKEKGYDYIYGTGEPASILYAKDSYDLTKEIIKMVNDKYKLSDKKEEPKKDKKK